MPDPRRAANLRRRIAMLRYHASMRGADGKSISARKAGRAGWRKRVEQAGSPTILGLELALKRRHPDDDAADAARQGNPRNPLD